MTRPITTTDIEAITAALREATLAGNAKRKGRTRMTEAAWKAHMQAKLKAMGGPATGLPGNAVKGEWKPTAAEEAALSAIATSGEFTLAKAVAAYSGEGGQ